MEKDMNLNDISMGNNKNKKMPNGNELEIDMSAELDDFFDRAAKDYAHNGKVDGKDMLKEIMKKTSFEQDFELSDGSVLTFDPTEGAFMIDGATMDGNFYLDGEDISAQKAIKLIENEVKTRANEVEKGSLDGHIKGLRDGVDKNLQEGSLLHSPDLFQNLGNKDR